MARELQGSAIWRSDEAVAFQSDRPCPNGSEPTTLRPRFPQTGQATTRGSLLSAPSPFLCTTRTVDPTAGLLVVLLSWYAINLPEPLSCQRHPSPWSHRRQPSLLFSHDFPANRLRGQTLLYHSRRHTVHITFLSRLWTLLLHPLTPQAGHRRHACRILTFSLCDSCTFGLLHCLETAWTPDTTFARPPQYSSSCKIR